VTEIDTTASAGQMNSMVTPKPEPDLRAQGARRIADISTMVKLLHERFTDLDTASVSQVTMDRLSSVKNHLEAAVTAVSVDKAHLDIRRAQEVKKRAEEFLDELGEE
jgi:hypothetical protein